MGAAFAPPLLDALQAQPVLSCGGKATHRCAGRRGTRWLEWIFGREHRCAEAQLPFRPIFEYLYVLTYFIPALLIVTVRDYATLRRLLRATGLPMLAAYTTYLLFPVYFARPLLQVSSLHTWLLSLEYEDKPSNHFPSLHVTLSWLAVHAAQVSRRSRVGLGVLATGINVSTVFVKQHYIVDVLYGCALPWVA